MKGVRAVAGGEATSRMSKEGERLTTSMRKKEQELDQREKETCRGGKGGEGGRESGSMVELDEVGTKIKLMELA